MSIADLPQRRRVHHVHMPLDQRPKRRLRPVCDVIAQQVKIFVFRTHIVTLTVKLPAGRKGHTFLQTAWIVHSVNTNGTQSLWGKRGGTANSHPHFA